MFTCSHCGGEFKNEHGLKVHVGRYCKGVSRPPHPVAVAEGASAPSVSRTVRFVSPKSANLRVVIKPTAWERVLSPGAAGQQVIQTVQIEGKAAQFVDGLFTTEDPVIIEYLENVYSKKPENAMFPIYSQKIMADLVK